MTETDSVLVRPKRESLLENPMLIPIIIVSVVCNMLLNADVQESVIFDES